MIFLMIMSSVFYLQKIIQNNNQNYYVKNQLYQNLNLLQQYLYKSSVVTDGQSLKFFDKNNTLILTQKLEQNQIKNIYSNKTITQIEYVNLQTYTVQLMNNDRVLKIEISWLDSRGKVQNLTEYLIVINHIL